MTHGPNDTTGELKFVIKVLEVLMKNLGGMFRDGNGFKDGMPANGFKLDVLELKLETFVNYMNMGENLTKKIIELIICSNFH